MQAVSSVISSNVPGVPEPCRPYVVDQEYSAYDVEAQAVWRSVLARNREQLARFGEFVHPAYLEGMRALDLPSSVPSVEVLNQRLAGTGWRTVCVNGYIPSSAYVALMAARVFPVSRRIRRLEHVDFAPAPDLVHDVLGHLPMLFCPEHREYLQRLASVMSRARANALDSEFYDVNVRLSALKEQPGGSRSAVAAGELEVERVNRALLRDASELTELRRIYVWSVEFGILGDLRKPLIHGAALLSAPAELEAVCLERARLERYSLDVVRYENAFSDLLAQYFVARDFAELHRVLDAYERGRAG